MQGHFQVWQSWRLGKPTRHCRPDWTIVAENSNSIPGQTPFLLSNTLLRAIEAVVDTTNHTVTSPMLKKTIPLTINERGLYLVDLNDLASPAHKTDQPSETFVITNSQKEGFRHQQASSIPKEPSQASGTPRAFV